MLDGCASSFHPCHASGQHVDLRKKLNEDNQDVHFLISGEYDDHIVRLLILFKCHVFNPRRAMLSSCHLGAKTVLWPETLPT